MKITKQHQEIIRNAISEVLAKYPDIVEKYEAGNFPRSECVKDLQTRFNFDLLTFANLTKWVCDNIYTYANDTHLATCLKSICPKITRKY